MTIIHSPTVDSPFLVVFKPAGIPSAPLFEGDESVLTESIRLFPEIEEIHGKKEVEHGLLHRIDTETSGLVLIATTQESYDALAQAQKENLFEKWYRAEVEPIPDCAQILGGFPPHSERFLDSLRSLEMTGSERFSVQSAFRAFGKKGREVRPVSEGAGRAALKKGGSVLYQTEISFEAESVALCHITAGFRHQVRCHLAWCGFPVKGDKIYNPNAREIDYRVMFRQCSTTTPDNDNSENTHGMCFTACKISFPHPISGETLTFEIPQGE